MLYKFLREKNNQYSFAVVKPRNNAQKSKIQTRYNSGTYILGNQSPCIWTQELLNEKEFMPVLKPTKLLVVDETMPREELIIAVH